MPETLRSEASSLEEREVVVEEATLALKREELALRREEQQSARRWNPLTVAIAAATLAGLANAAASLINGVLTRELEVQRSDHARILEMLRTGSTEKAAENLQFLIDAGLIADSTTAARLRASLANRKPGSGPQLPAGWTNEDPAAYQYKYHSNNPSKPVDHNMLNDTRFRDARVEQPAKAASR